MKRKIILLGLLFAGVSAHAACPKKAIDFNFSKEGPILLVKLVSEKKHPGITDFSSEIGKKAESGVLSFEAGSE